MAKLKVPSQKAQYRLLGKRLNKYVALVQSAYDGMAKDVAKLVSSTDYDGEKPFEFKDFPELKKGIDDTLAYFANDVHHLIYAGTTDEWRRSNLFADVIADKAGKYYGGDWYKKRDGRYYQTNPEALQAFQERKVKGMNLSQKLWSQNADVKAELEETISTAVEKGTSAIALSKRVSQYLNDFPSMQKDYGEKFGRASKAKNCQYASIRLARSEINMAYRTAEQKRWQQMDFIIGYEVKTTNNKSHVSDMCDALAGKYPKDFHFVGWHPNCMCYAVPLFKTEDEYWDDQKMQEYIESGGEEETPSANEIVDVPDSFKQWCVQNEKRITASEKHGTLPYFIRDNKDRYEEIRKQVESVETDEPQKQRFKFKSIEHLENVLSKFDIDYRNQSYFDSPNFYDKSPLGGFDLESYDTLVKDIYKEIGLTVDKGDIYLASGQINIEYVFETEYEDFMLSRKFLISDDGKRHVEHVLFDLPEEAQGKGFSKRLFKHLFEQYESMGIDVVDVHANIDVGGYCWAKYGFKATLKNAKDAIWQALDMKNITREQYDVALAKIKPYEGEEYFPMKLLAELPFGKKMLKGTDWDGVIDLHDSIQMEYVHDYITSKPKNTFDELKKRWGKLSVEEAKQVRLATRDEERIRRMANTRDEIQWTYEDYYQWIADVRKWSKVLDIDISDLEDFLRTADFKASYVEPRQQMKEIVLAKKEIVDDKLTEWNDSLERLNNITQSGKYIVDGEKIKNFIGAHQPRRGVTMKDEMSAVEDFRIELEYESKHGGENTILRPKGRDIKQLEYHPEWKLQKKYEGLMEMARMHPDVQPFKGVIEKHNLAIELFGEESKISEQSKQYIVDVYETDDYWKSRPIFSLRHDTAWHWNEMIHAKDLGMIPNQWRAKFSEIVKKINDYNPSKNDYYKIANEIDEAYNIYRLSKEPLVAKIGFDKFSAKTPYQIPRRIRLWNKPKPEEWIPDKRLFDVLKGHWYFYTLDESKDAYCHWTTVGEQFVNVPWDKTNRYKCDAECFKQVFYHEYGHAIDREGATEIDGANGHSKSETFKALMKKWTESYHAISSEQLTEKYKEAVDISDIQNVNYWMEQMGSFGDVFQAFVDGHKPNDFGGHDEEYMQKKSNQHCETFAHCSEIFFQGNDVIKASYPELYKEMLDYFTELFKTLQK